MKNKTKNQEFIKKFSRKQPIVEIIYPNSSLGIFQMKQACCPGADAAAGASSH
jgi:hypothetical protein